MALIRTAEGLLEAETATLTDDQKERGNEEIVKMLNLSMAETKVNVEELARFLGLSLSNN